MGSYNGYVDGLHFFTVYYHGAMLTKGEALATAKLYRVTSHLPGGKVYKCESYNRGKEVAAILLTQFLTRVAA